MYTKETLEIKGVNKSKLTDKLIKDFITFGKNNGGICSIRMVVYLKGITKQGVYNYDLRFEYLDCPMNETVLPSYEYEVISLGPSIYTNPNLKNVIRYLRRDLKLEEVYLETLNITTLCKLESTVIGDIIVQSVDKNIKEFTASKNYPMLGDIDNFKKQQRENKEVILTLLGVSNYWEIISYYKDTVRLRSIKDVSNTIDVSAYMLSQNFSIVKRPDDFMSRLYETGETSRSGSYKFSFWGL